jgi:orotidine-5'-phosphate decarboxylase
VRLRDWLESRSLKSHSRLVLALDTNGPYSTRLDRASSILAQVGDRIAGVKVNWHLLLPFGAIGLGRLAEQCGELGIPLIADMKLNDIASTNVEAAETLFANGFEAVIANPFVGYREGMKDLIARSHELGKGVILLVYMSHAGAREGYGLKVGGEPLYARFAREARRWGADGVVVSGKAPAVIRSARRLVGEEIVILSPGIGFQGGDAAKARRAGADYLIVGRAIVDAADPAAVVDSLNAGLP